jgi:PAS domain S-box-containing protein
MAVFSLLIEKCSDDYYYRYISDNITYYIPSYNTNRLNQAVSNFEVIKEYHYSGSIKEFLDKVYELGELTINTTVTDIQNKKDIELTFIGYKYNNYLVIIGTQKVDTFLEDTLFKEDYIFLIRWLNNKEEKIDDISDNVISLLGYTKEVLLSKPYLEFIHSDDKEFFSKELEQYIKNNNPSFYQRYRLVDSSGKAISILDHSCVIHNSSGSAIVGYLRDISLEVEMSTKLKELIDLDEDSFNSSAIIKIEWNKDCNVTRWNKQACESLGWKNELVLDKHISELNLFNEEDSIKFQGQIYRIIHHEVDSVVSSFKVTRKDGSLLDTKWSNRLISRNGESRVLSTVIDQSQEALLTTRLDEMEERSDLLLKTLFNTNSVSNEVFGKLVHNPLTSNPEGLIKAEIIIRKLEEEISRLNNTIFYNNDNNLINDVAILKNEDHLFKEKLVKLEEKNKELSEQLEKLLNINVLSFYKSLNFKNVLGVIIICYVIFGQWIPAIYPTIIRPTIDSINKEFKQIKGKD